MIGRLPAQLDHARRHARQLHPGPARSPGPASQLLDQLAGSTAPGMPKRPPVSSRSTITAPGQLAGLLVAPRPMYGHATSSQPANRCSTGQLHSIAGASFPGQPARLPGGQQLTRPAHTRPRCGPRATQPAQNRPRSSSFVASPALGPRPGAQLPGRPRQLAASRCHTPGTLDSFPGHSFTLDRAHSISLPAASTPRPARRRTRPRPRCAAPHARQLRRRTRPAPGIEWPAAPGPG